MRVNLNRVIRFLKNFFGENAIVADLLDLEQAAIRLETNSSPYRQVAQVLADIKVAGVVDGGFRAQGAAFFVILLNARSLVVDMEGRNHSVGDNPRAKWSGRAFRNPALKDELDLFGAANVEVLPDYFLAENPSAYRAVEPTVEPLGGKFHLQDGRSLRRWTMAFSVVPTQTPTGSLRRALSREDQSPGRTARWIPRNDGGIGSTIAVEDTGCLR